MGFSRKNSIRRGKLLWMQYFRIISLVAKLLPLYSKVMRHFLAERQTSQKGVKLKEGWWKDLSQSLCRRWAIDCRHCLHFLLTVTVEGRTVVITLLPHPTPSSMEGINLGSHISWIFAIEAPRWLSLYREMEDVTVPGGSKGCLRAGSPEIWHSTGWHHGLGI